MNELIHGAGVFYVSGGLFYCFRQYFCRECGSLVTHGLKARNIQPIIHALSHSGYNGCCRWNLDWSYLPICFDCVHIWNDTFHRKSDYFGEPMVESETQMVDHFVMYSVSLVFSIFSALYG
jgi:hypothetical protein